MPPASMIPNVEWVGLVPTQVAVQSVPDETPLMDVKMQPFARGVLLDAGMACVGDLRRHWSQSGTLTDIPGVKAPREKAIMAAIQAAKTTVSPAEAYAMAGQAFAAALVELANVTDGQAFAAARPPDPRPFAFIVFEGRTYLRAWFVLPSPIIMVNRLRRAGQTGFARIRSWPGIGPFIGDGRPGNLPGRDRCEEKSAPTG